MMTQIENARSQLRILASVHPRIIIKGGYLRKMKQKGVCLGFLIDPEYDNGIYFNFGNNGYDENVKVWIDAKMNTDKSSVSVYEISSGAFARFIYSCKNSLRVEKALREFINSLPNEHKKLIEFNQFATDFENQISLVKVKIEEKNLTLKTDQETLDSVEENLDSDSEYQKLLKQKEAILEKIAKKEARMKNLNEKVQVELSENKVLEDFLIRLEDTKYYNKKSKIWMISGFVSRNKDFQKFLKENGFNVNLFLKG